jgi:hypothetical protein
LIFRKEVEGIRCYFILFGLYVSTQLDFGSTIKEMGTCKRSGGVIVIPMPATYEILK